MSAAKSEILRDLVFEVRSKNAGPFWVTVDVFCGGPTAYARANQLLSAERVAKLYHLPLDTLKRFELPELYVLKFSFPRPVIQGSRFDRDMHGAQYSELLSELTLDVN